MIDIDFGLLVIIELIYQYRSKKNQIGLDFQFNS